VDVQKISAWNFLKGGGFLAKGWDSNNWSDGGSSENECNSEFDLNHVEYRNVRVISLAINAKVM
jgi:hypothetical protein